MQKVSVICVTYNAEKTLEKTILSVLNQNYGNFEFVIVDGKSKDSTVDIIKKYDDRIKWISEPDNGIFDAMNKAVALSTGDWVYFIGADDFFVDNSVLANMFVEDYNYDDYDVVFGKVKYSNGQILKCSLNWKTKYINTLHHQGCFYKRSLFENYKYEPDYSISSDYELNLILYLKKAKYIYRDIIIAEFFLDGTSGQTAYKGYKWEMILRNKNIKNPIEKLFINSTTLGRYFLKKMMMVFGLTLKYRN